MKCTEKQACVHGVLSCSLHKAIKAANCILGCNLLFFYLFIFFNYKHSLETNLYHYQDNEMPNISSLRIVLLVCLVICVCTELTLLPYWVVCTDCFYVNTNSQLFCRYLKHQPWWLAATKAGREAALRVVHARLLLVACKVQIQ